VGGCTSAHYRKSADKEVYRIIQAVDNQVFGRTNAFSIDSPYSGRDPKSILPAEIIEERTSVGRRVINLDQALDLAFQHSREYQTQKEQLYLTALSLTGARYEFSPQFIATSTGQITGTPGGSDVGSVRSQISVSQLLKSGGRLTLSLGNDLVRYFTGKPDLVARNSAINSLSVDLTQPILRGFGINDPSVESLTQAERNVIYAVRSFSLYQQRFAVDTVTAYFSLLTVKDIVRNNYRNYTNRVETTRYLEARSVDRASRIQVDDAQTAELQARISYINAVASYLTAADQFKTRLGLPLSEELYLDDQDLRALIESGLVPADINREAAFAICVEKHMDLLNAIDRFEDSKRKVRVAADRLRAELSLFSNASLQSEGPDDYVNFDFDKLRYTAGLRLNLPIDRLRERNNYRSTLVSFESQLRSLGLSLDNYKDRIDRGLRTLEQSRLSYLNGVESLKVAERRVDNATLSLEAGRTTVRDLRESQDSLIQAQNNLSTIYASYLSTRLNLMIDIGVLDSLPEKFWLTDLLEGRITPEQRGAPVLRMPEDNVIHPDTFLEPRS
jgi:outer membrane protein TolC